MSYSNEVVPVLNDKYRKDALRVFISGLRKPLCDIMFSSRPVDLPSALALAQELQSNHERYIFATSFANKIGPTKTNSTKNNDDLQKAKIPFSQKDHPNKIPFSKTQPNERNPHFLRNFN